MSHLNKYIIFFIIILFACSNQKKQNDDTWGDIYDKYLIQQDSIIDFLEMIKNYNFESIDTSKYQNIDTFLISVFYPPHFYLEYYFDIQNDKYKLTTNNTQEIKFEELQLTCTNTLAYSDKSYLLKFIHYLESKDTNYIVINHEYSMDRTIIKVLYSNKNKYFYAIDYDPDPDSLNFRTDRIYISRLIQILYDLNCIRNSEE